jgi:hypothetical protein
MVLLRANSLTKAFKGCTINPITNIGATYMPTPKSHRYHCEKFSTKLKHIYEISLTIDKDLYLSYSTSREYRKIMEILTRNSEDYYEATTCDNNIRVVGRYWKEKDARAFELMVLRIAHEVVHKGRKFL